MKPFRQRASKMGLAMNCMASVAFDRMVHEGIIEKPLEDEDKPYADLGTCIHFVMQDGIRAIFPKILEPDARELADAMVHFDNNEKRARAALAKGDAKAFMYSERQLASAATLFGGEIELTRKKIREMATLGAKELPASPDGKLWLAEVPVATEYMTGHIDLLSQDGTVCIDLKTSQRPPDHGHMKTDHLAQLTMYHLGAGFRYARILNVDAKGAEWTMLSPEIDFASEAMREYAEHVKGYAQFIQTPDFFQVAVPQLGKHCSEGWCAHKTSCRSKYMPPAGVVKKAIQYAAPKGKMALT